MSGRLVGPTAFKAAEAGDPRLAGSIPVHLRELPVPAGPPGRRPSPACIFSVGENPIHRRELRRLAGIPAP